MITVCDSALPTTATYPWPAQAGVAPALAITKRLTTYWPHTAVPCRLSVTLASPMAADTAMLVNLKLVKGWVNQALAVAGQHPKVTFTPTTPPHALPWAFLLDALCEELTQSLPTHLSTATLVRVQLDTLTGQVLTWQPDSTTPPSAVFPPPRSLPMHVLTRRYEFSAAHRLCNPAFDEDTNWAVFYECNNPHGHGHNYELEVMLAGDPDPTTGMLINLLDLDTLVQQHLVKPMDHKHLNHDVAFLAGTITTAETVAMACYHQLKPHLPAGVELYGVRLHESRNNAAEYYGQSLVDADVLPVPI